MGTYGPPPKDNKTATSPPPPVKKPDPSIIKVEVKP
jgi:hypothetical protein